MGCDNGRRSRAGKDATRRKADDALQKSRSGLIFAEAGQRGIQINWSLERSSAILLID